MTQDDLDAIKKEFIVDQEKYDVGNIPSQIRRILKFARVGTHGAVFIENTALPTELKLKLILVARFLANKLQPEISSGVTIEELSEHAQVDKDQVRARMSTLVRDKFAGRENRGIFVVLAFQVQKFLEELDNRGGE